MMKHFRHQSILREDAQDYTNECNYCAYIKDPNRKDPNLKQNDQERESFVFIQKCRNAEMQQGNLSRGRHA